jgi:hypothetical protein
VFVIYTPEIKTFLHCVTRIDTGLYFEWDYKVQEIGILHNLDDAIALADEVQQARINEEVFHFSIQVLSLNPWMIPNFNHPEYDLPSKKRVS